MILIGALLVVCVLLLLIIVIQQISLGCMLRAYGRAVRQCERTTALLEEFHVYGEGEEIES